jgi:hypothetical protein
MRHSQRAHALSSGPLRMRAASAAGYPHWAREKAWRIKGANKSVHRREFGFRPAARAQHADSSLQMLGRTPNRNILCGGECKKNPTLRRSKDKTDEFGPEGGGVCGLRENNPTRYCGECGARHNAVRQCSLFASPGGPRFRENNRQVVAVHRGGVTAHRPSRRKSRSISLPRNASRTARPARASPLPARRWSDKPRGRAGRIPARNPAAARDGGARLRCPRGAR